VWLDRGKIYEFSKKPRELERQLRHGLRDRRASDRLCPRCHDTLERGLMPDRDAEVEECPACGGFWFDHDQLQRAMQLAADPSSDPGAESDPATQEAARERLRQVAAGVLALPNLLFRSVVTLGILYGILALVLITVGVFTNAPPEWLVAAGVVIAALQ